MKIAFTEPETQQAISELLRPWEFQVAASDEADVTICQASHKTQDAQKILLIPNDSEEFRSLVARSKLGFLRREMPQQLEVSVTESVSLTLNAQTVYSCGKSHGSPSGCLVDDSTYFMGVDVVAQYSRILNATFNAKPSMRYKLFTSLPIPYTLAPKRLRDIVMTHKSPDVTLDYHDKLPIDALRFMLVNAIQMLTEQKMELAKAVDGRAKTVYLITHDIDCRKGLDRALSVKQIEEKYDVESVWFVPSNHYPLDSDILGKLANNGEVGSHDTEHDGKLACLKGSKLVSRLQEGKAALEKTGNCAVNGFRAPLLQHNFEILEALKSASFSYDSSTPTFEPNHPRTMGSHGLGTVYPINVKGFLEIPLTLIQDHQLLYTLGFKPEQVYALWEVTASLIKSLGGACVVLSHPEYQLFEPENIALYEDFLNKITADTDNKIMTLSKFSEAWATHDH